MTLPSDDQALVELARRQGIVGPNESFDYPRGWMCTALSIGLVPFTLGFSLVFVPIAWIVRSDRTASRINRLRTRLQGG
jgi:hypothetical protein